MPLRIRHAILPVLGLAGGLAALGAAQSETVVRLAAPEAVTVTRLPGSVEGLAADIAAMAAPAPARAVAPVPAPAHSAAPMRSLRPDPRPEIFAMNTVTIRQADAPVVLAMPRLDAAPNRCAALAAMPGHLPAGAFRADFARVLNGVRCAD